MITQGGVFFFFLNDKNPVEVSMSDVLAGRSEPEVSFSCEERLLFVEAQNSQI